MPKLTLFLLSQKYAVCRLEPNGYIPSWALLGDDFVSLTRTREELSIACLQENVPSDALASRNWRCLRAQGPFDFSQVGINLSLAVPLAEAGISVLTIATYETDHVLIQEKDLEHGMLVLERAGHRILR